MRLHKTGHEIADTVSDLIGELIDGNYKIAYGILRHNLFDELSNWFEIDKGFWGADHFCGRYRMSCKGTQPRYDSLFPHSEPHGLTLHPWRNDGTHTLICPPTQHVCEFFGIVYTDWLMAAIKKATGTIIMRGKGSDKPIEWESICQVITFNSTVGIEALCRGIPVISDPVHSSIGSYTKKILSIDGYDREPLFCWLAGHQFKLDEKEKINCLIRYYLTKSISGGIAEKQ